MWIYLDKLNHKREHDQNVDANLVDVWYSRTLQQRGGRHQMVFLMEHLDLPCHFSTQLKSSIAACWFSLLAEPFFLPLPKCQCCKQGKQIVGESLFLFVSSNH